MNKEAKRWLKQAEADLKAVKDSVNSANYEWACFQSQQAGEKALKAYLYSHGYTSIITHSLKMLLKECVKLDKSFADIDEEARILDTYYIPVKFPNGIDEEIAPFEYYDEEDAEKCLKCATLILEKVKKFLKN